MGDMKEYFDEMKAHKKQLNSHRLEEFNPDGWTSHSPYHYSRKIDDVRLDYYPSTNTCRWKGRTIKPAKSFIQKLLKSVTE
jgi:hypothetical protein